MNNGARQRGRVTLWRSTIMSLGPNTLPPGLEDARRLWFLFFLLGAALFVAGMVAIICSAAASLISVLVWGWFLMVRGGLEATFALWSRRFSASLLHLVLGV